MCYEELLRDQPQLSLARFAREAGVPAWTLRDARQQIIRQQERDIEQQIVLEQVRTVALAHPTYGYRRVHQVLRSAAGEPSTFGLLGQHTVRLALGTLYGIERNSWSSGERSESQPVRFGGGGREFGVVSEFPGIGAKPY